MGLAVTPEYAYVNLHTEQRVVGEYASGAQSWGGNVGILSGQMNQVSYGRSVYPFWEQRVGRLLPELTGESHGYRFQVEGISRIDGSGETPNESLENFREQFHTEFQRLFVKRPFEMEPDEARSWDELKQVVDVESYRRTIPVLTREYGRVESNRPGHWSVHWDAGGHTPIDLEMFPDEFASYKPGQPFEAYVERDQQTMAIRRIYNVARRSTPIRHTAADNAAFMESLESNKDLPVTTLE